MIREYYEKEHPVEYLIFQVKNPEDIDLFIELDQKIWTTYLASFKGFISKEVWINKNNPGEIHTILIWDNMDAWKGIPIEELKAKDKDFIQAFGKEFEMTRRIHKEYNHGLHKVRHYEIQE